MVFSSFFKIIDYFGFAVTSLLTSVFGIIWASLTRVGTLDTLKLSLVFYSLFRTFVFTFTFAYLADVLGFSYYGVLAGVLFMTSGFIGLLQYWLRIAIAGTCHLKLEDTCSHGNWHLLHTIVLISLILILPIISYKDYWRRRTSPHMSKPKSNFDVHNYITGG